MLKRHENSDSLASNNVVISNSIIRSAQTLSLVEKRIIMAGIAKLKGVNGEITLTAKEYADTYEVDMSTAYDGLRGAVETLMTRRLSWQVKDGRKIGNLTCIWVQGFKYFKDEGCVKFRFSEYIFPFLFDLQKEFTKYKLRQAVALRSIHSWRLLELLQQMANGNKKNWLQMSLEDFWHAMDAKDSYKTNFGLLRKWVIEPAVKELREKDNWLIDWHPIKKGRRVDSIYFEFERNPQGSLFD